MRRRNASSSRRFGLGDSVDLVNVLPEEERIAEVTANFWGTKFQITSHYLDLLPPCLGQVVYRASLLHLQPRQMRLELTDLREDNSDPFGCSLWGEDEEEEEEEEEEDGEFSALHQGVSMRDNILRAVAAAPTAGAASLSGDKSSVAVDQNKKSEEDDGDASKAAIVAPLPTRLSFILPSSSGSNANTPSGDIVEALLRQQQQQQQQRQRESEIKSPTAAAAASPQKSSAQNCQPSSTEVDAGVILNSEVPTTFNPQQQQSPVGRSNRTAESSTQQQQQQQQQQPLQQLQLSSPARRRLRMSLSCDNYLGDAKLSLSRRDSVGSGSPHSSKGSPRRWAAKVEEVSTPAGGGVGDDIMVTSAMAQLGSAAAPPAAVSGAAAMVSPTKTASPAATAASAACRSSSLGDGLDAIVDLLGVPSDLVPPSDLNKRLVLLKEEEDEAAVAEEEVEDFGDKRRRRPSNGGGRPKLEKSKSCEGVKRRRRRRRPEGGGAGGEDFRKSIELKRRSLYAKDECKGRSEDKTCSRCADVAEQVDDALLNREIFDVVVVKKEAGQDEKEQETEKKEIDKSVENKLREDLLIALESNESRKQQQHHIVSPPPPPKHHAKASSSMLMPSIRENIPSTPRARRKSSSQQQQQQQLPDPPQPPPLSNRPPQAEPRIEEQEEEPPKRPVHHRRDRSSSARRRFDSVRGLLEKARSILLFSRSKRDRSASRTRGGGRRGGEPSPSAAAGAAGNNVHLPPPPPSCTPAVARRSENIAIVTNRCQSSPNTPLSKRRGGGVRNRSFSPVRAILNSPLLRRKKRSSIDSSEEELLNPGGGADAAAEGEGALEGERGEAEARGRMLAVGGGEEDGQEEATATRGSYRNLETFQKQQLRQKVKKVFSYLDVAVFRKTILTSFQLKKLNDNPPAGIGGSLLSASGPSNSSSSNSNSIPTPSSTPLFLSPLLRRSAKMGLPSSPNLSILNRKSNGGQQQQDQRGCSAEKWQLPNAPPPIRVRKRRKLVLRNKAPMWNETSQVV